MSRTVQISLPPEHSEGLISKIQGIDGLISLRVQKNISVKPRGDVISFELTNPAVNNFLILIEKEGLLENHEVSITTSEPTNIISRPSSKQILKETHETSWEDVLQNLLHESNMTLNGLLIMFFSGVMAAIGISINSLHLVVGAMLIAPGFEPISRFSLGMITKHKDWKNGFYDSLKGYLILILGGITGALTIKLLGKDVIPGSSSYLAPGVLASYWTSITATSLIVSMIASIAGGIIIMTNKTILTAGVMVALALIPSGTLVGMRLVEGDFFIAGKASLRLIIDIGMVAFFTGAVFLWKKSTLHKREMHA